MRGSQGGAGGQSPQGNHKAIGFFSYSGPAPMENHKATTSTFIIGPLSARLCNAISIAFRLLADDGPLLVVFGKNKKRE